MNIAHLILAHNKPKQLKRLVERLRYQNDDVYIHIDAKANITQFQDLAKLPNVYMVAERVKVYWGSFNIVQATINGFEAIVNSGKQYGYINLLSGQDYPLKPMAQLHNFLDANPGKIYVNHLIAEKDWREALPRVEGYHFNNFNLPGKYALQAAINKVLPKRKIPGGLTLVGRSQWFTASADSVKYFLDYWNSHPALRRFMKFTWAPDEFLFHTVWYNSEWKSHMLTEDLRYIDWSGGGVSPKTLTMADAESLLASGKYFARKFDEDKEAAVMDYIDKQTLN